MKTLSASVTVNVVMRKITTLGERVLWTSGRNRRQRNLTFKKECIRKMGGKIELS